MERPRPQGLPGEEDDGEPMGPDTIGYPDHEAEAQQHDGRQPQQHQEEAAEQEGRRPDNEGADGGDSG
eukprot:5157978-Heterocapsa_arctica.AAC.1